eukprot:12054319-Alexandrium_andersonii.AAC.1
MQGSTPIRQWTSINTGQWPRSQPVRSFSTVDPPHPRRPLGRAPPSASRCSSSASGHAWASCQRRPVAGMRARTFRRSPSIRWRVAYICRTP